MMALSLAGSPQPISLIFLGFAAAILLVLNKYRIANVLLPGRFDFKRHTWNAGYVLSASASFRVCGGQA
jgi:hypothetical protein